mmetsp:Transcript_43251/g.110051  ORF Transcript_43251/g.110051 Transcript_43251/m.110051 type:complete len:86 (-) Transcript_43251:518-775(-)
MVRLDTSLPWSDMLTVAPLNLAGVTFGAPWPDTLGGVWDLSFEPACTGVDLDASLPCAGFPTAAPLRLAGGAMSSGSWLNTLGGV